MKIKWDVDKNETNMYITNVYLDNEVQLKAVKQWKFSYAGNRSC